MDPERKYWKIMFSSDSKYTLWNKIDYPRGRQYMLTI